MSGDSRIVTDSVDYEKGGVPRKLSASFSWSSTLRLSFQSIGVIYGDLGTSPLYVFPGIYSHPPKPEQVYVAISLIFWFFTLVVIVKYVFLLLWADDDGQGGTFALYSIILRHLGCDTHGRTTEKSIPPKKGMAFQTFMAFLVVLGVSFVLGDGVLTPAISVLSAMEGMAVALPVLHNWVIPSSICILLLLFSIQRCGTARVSNVFAPILFLWLVSIGGVGFHNLLKNTKILNALSPFWVIHGFLNEFRNTWGLMGGTLLSITGVEAMFADLGHFNRPAIQISATFIVYPSLMLAYLGQGACLLDHPEYSVHIFWNSIPPRLYWIMFVLSVLATIIASQSMISAAYSLIYQGIKIDCFPPVAVYHTSSHDKGQVYVPLANWTICALVMMVVLIFQKSVHLTTAFGISTAGIIFITDIIFSIVIANYFNMFLAIAYFICFGTISMLFLSSACLKFASGGWLPFTFALTLMSFMQLWRWGERSRKGFVDNQAMSASSYSLKEETSGPEVVFFFSTVESNDLIHLSWKRYQQVPKCLVIVHQETISQPYNPKPLTVRRVNQRIFQANLAVGFMEKTTTTSEMMHQWFIEAFPDATTPTHLVVQGKDIVKVTTSSILKKILLGGLYSLVYRITTGLLCLNDETLAKVLVLEEPVYL